MIVLLIVNAVMFWSLAMIWKQDTRLNLYLKIAFLILGFANVVVVVSLIAKGG